MITKLSCPQCHAALKLPETPVVGKGVTCPSCRIKFIPPDPTRSAAAPARGGSWIPMILVALIAAGGGGFGSWYWNNRTSPGPSIEPPVNDPTPVAVVEPKAPVNLPVNVEVKPPIAAPAPVVPVVPAKVAEKGPDPKPAPPNDDELPESPKPMPKKVAPKVYAETKKPAAIVEPPPAPVVVAAKVETAVPAHSKQKQINKAIDEGVAYLKKTQLPSGAWQDLLTIQLHLDVGYTALAGLTLLECQAPADDPAVQKAAAYVRSNAVGDRTHRNYQMACVVLFLDRLGDPQDKAMIQNYALQLAAGQSFLGGWSYSSPELTAHELKQLLVFLEATRLPGSDPALPSGAKSSDDPLKGAVAKGDTDTPGDEPKNAGEPAKPDPKKAPAKPKPAVPQTQKLTVGVARVPVVYQFYWPKAPPPTQVGPGSALMLGSSDDNSNTQFAILALWAARRHGVPTERCLLFAAQHFRSSQKPDGGWSYQSNGLTAGGSTPAMTSVGLLGLAMGKGIMPKAAANKLTEDVVIQKGLSKLGEHIDVASMSNFYFLWSVERVAMLYGLKELGNQDWYDVGVHMLLPGQQNDGSWATRGYQGSSAMLDTCFALLFLKRSNLVEDLTRRLPFMMSISEKRK